MLGDFTRNDAILLVGPTGAGKSPLGDLLAESDIDGKRCFHFDFGENLRRTASQQSPDDLFDKQDLRIVDDALKKGKLLENESFHIARKILHTFMRDHSVMEQDLLILNGLPRHIGQANDTDQLVNISAILSLECTSEIVHARILRNTGGDRTHRTDDSLAEIQAKLRTFEHRTFPLLGHYTNKGVSVHHLQVSLENSPHQMLERALDVLGA